MNKVITTKRALVVDDSKSARFALKRTLKEFNFNVDTAASAKDALDYLTEHHPDVIFMDHMMPGMDGFEAIKLIKANPLTAVIPIMMYTSKGSDLYLSQARALGAVGIVPKTIAPVELKKSLLELGLIKNTPDKSSLKIDKTKTVETQINQVTIKTTKDKNTADTYLEDLRKLMDDQTIELHKSMWLGIESVGNEIFSRLNNELEVKLEAINNIKIKSESAPANSPVKSNKAIYAVIFLFFISAIFNVALFVKNNKVENKLEIITNKQTIEENKKLAQIKLLAQNKNHKQSFINNTTNKVIEYPYDELALNDNRLLIIERLINKAIQVEFKGKITLQTHIGEFCLSNDQMGNFILADDALPANECEYIGNYIQPSDLPSTHLSLAFANFLSDSSILNEKDIVLEITNLTRKAEPFKYPQQLQQTSAEQWNRAAQLNNRVLIKLEPRTVEL